MSFTNLLTVEFQKTKRSWIIPLIFIAPLLVVITGVANVSRYFTPEYTNAWGAMFIQSALVYAYYLLPLSMIVVCVMLFASETQNNGLIKMLSLPVHPHRLALAKFCVLVFYLLMETAVFLIVFIAAGLIAAANTQISQSIPVVDLVRWSLGLFVTMLPALAVMWAATVVFEKPLASIGLNILLVIPGVLVANTPLWIVYPYCYSGYLVSCSLHDFTNQQTGSAFQLIPFMFYASGIFALFLLLSIIRFGKKEMR